MINKLGAMEGLASPPCKGKKKGVMLTVLVIVRVDSNILSLSFFYKE